jgi:hypothetical protein
MQLRPDALRFVLAQGLPAVIDVVGGSMAPTIERGAKVDVVGLPEAAAVDVGDIILVATADAAVLLLHRAMCVFEERGERFVIHQGDAPGSSFGTCRRADVLARMTSFAGGDAAGVDGGGARPAATVERLDVGAQARFRRRRLACEAYVVARLLALTFGVADLGLVRRCAHSYRALCRAVLH